MNTNHSVEVVFISVSGTTRKLMIRESVGGTTTPAYGTTTYNARTVVTLTATPNSGYKFVQWNQVGDIPLTTNPVTTTMNSDQWYQPVFAQGGGPTQYTLTIQVPTGLGTTNPGVGSNAYAIGTRVEFTAYPASGWVLDHWKLDGADVSSDNPSYVTMGADRTLQAVFTQVSSQYSVSVSVSGQGSVSKSPSQATYISDSSVQLTVALASGWVFAGWSGALTGTANPATLTVNGNKAVTATFILASPPSTNGVTHTVYKSGSTYYARTEATGAVTRSTNFKALFEWVFQSNRVIQIQPGTYYVTNRGGISVSYRSNVKVYGASGVIIKQALQSPAKATILIEQPFCTNIYWYDVTFDQDYKNPNHLPMTSYGMMANVKPGNSGSNIWFTRCQIINSADLAVLAGVCDGLHFIDCTIDYCGEHVFYLTSITNLEVKNCNIYNWAKYGRGFTFKLTACEDVQVTDCWFEPNEDGLGYGAAGISSDPASGVYGPVIMDYCKNLYFTGCTWKNDNTNSARNVGLRIALNYPVYNLNFSDCHWYGLGAKPVIGTNSYNNVAQLHLTGCTFN